MPRVDPTPPDTRTILENVAWIIEHLDEHGLEEVHDLPILELAKHISVVRKAA
jgi:hypothetical protein